MAYNGHPLARYDSSARLVSCIEMTPCEMHQRGIVIVTGHVDGAISLYDLVFPGDIDLPSGNAPSRLAPRKCDLRPRHVLKENDSAEITAVRLTRDHRGIIAGNVYSECMLFQTEIVYTLR